MIWQSLDPVYTYLSSEETQRQVTANWWPLRTFIDDDCGAENWKTQQSFDWNTDGVDIHVRVCSIECFCCGISVIIFYLNMQYCGIQIISSVTIDFTTNKNR